MKQKKYVIRPEIQLISFHDYINRRMLVFRKTCGMCPCQYDIFEDWNEKEPNYYGRLRWGFFYVATEPLGTPIYQHDFKEQYKGSFKDITEEIYYLKKACEKIWKGGKNGKEKERQRRTKKRNKRSRKKR